VVLGVPILAVAAFVAGFGMAVSGTWPFEPLDRRSRQIELVNGALIRIEGVEDRGWQSNGYLWTASFRQRDDADFVTIGSWIGPNDDLRVYTSGALIVCLNPNRRMIHVRGSNGQWKFFDLRLPGKTENLADFLMFNPALAEGDLRRFQAELTEAETRYSPATEIQAFDSVTLEIRARILTALTREATFGLSEDGQSVSLKSLRVTER
jgi:hypothetical protein